jgi:hypothetical protein
MIVGEVVVAGEVFVGGGEEGGRVRRGQPGDAVAGPTYSEILVSTVVFNLLSFF